VVLLDLLAALIVKVQKKNRPPGLSLWQAHFVVTQWNQSKLSGTGGLEERF
jgi:hypothetical protein